MTGALDAPWGIAWAPDNFGEFSGDLLIGNFGDGRINAYEHESDGRLRLRGHSAAPKRQRDGDPGVVGAEFGNGNAAGPTNSLFFTAGPNGEKHGLFGSIEAQS